MQSNSVGYVLGFCTAVCLACSVVVATTAVGLKDLQEKNKVLDRQKKVLTVAGLLKEKPKTKQDRENLKPKRVRELFKKHIKPIIVDLKTGKIDKEATAEAASYDQQKAKKDPQRSVDVPRNRAGVPRVPKKALVYLYSKTPMSAKGKGFKLTMYILPVEGKGLWSTLLGYIALAPNFNLIKGLTFYSHGETPGLGGEVDNPSWKAKWPGRLVFGPKGSKPKNWGKPKIKVIKGSAGKPAKDPYRVDGLSGATITSNGVTHLLRFWLGKQGFGPFIKRQLGVNKKTASAPSNQPSKYAKQASKRSGGAPL